jgi:hypothetical protein
VASGGNLLWAVVWRVMVICYGLLCGEWWLFLTDVSAEPLVPIPKVQFVPIFR